MTASHMASRFNRHTILMSSLQSPPVIAGSNNDSAFNKRKVPSTQSRSGFWPVVPSRLRLVHRDPTSSRRVCFPSINHRVWVPALHCTYCLWAAKSIWLRLGSTVCLDHDPRRRSEPLMCLPNAQKVCPLASNFFLVCSTVASWYQDWELEQ